MGGFLLGVPLQHQQRRVPSTKPLVLNYGCKQPVYDIRVGEFWLRCVFGIMPTHA